MATKGANVTAEEKGFRIAVDIVIEAARLRREIVDGVAEKLAEDATKMMEAKLETRMSAVLDEVVAKRAKALINEGFEVPGTGQDPKARTVTLLDLMRERIKGYMEQKVDDSGNRVDPRDYGFGQKSTRAEWLVKGAANRVWDYKVKAIVNKAVEQMHAEVIRRANTEMAEKLRKVLGLGG